MPRRFGGAGIALALTLASCGSDETGAPLPPPTSTEAPPDPASDAPEADASPDETSPLDDQIAWLVAALNGSAIDPAAVTERFSDAFLSVRSAEVLVTAIEQFRTRAATWTIVEIDGDGIGAEVRLTTDAGPWTMLIAVDGDGRIETLALEAADAFGDLEPLESFDEIVEALRAVGDVAILVADVSGGTCDPVHAVDADAARPVGSDFKLYVLGALLDAIAAGSVGWTDPLIIDDALKSLPSGSFRDLDAGTELTVREFAEAMIAVSDNTATDHLIDLLGREAVEAAQAAYGHRDPGLNIPFLTTRELFALKLSLDEAERSTYIAADADERRTILETDVAARPPTLADAVDFTEPRAINDLEWFASPLDLCRAMVALNTDPTDAGAVAREILAVNPGGVDDESWSHVGFKGGGEPGVLSLAWYLEGARGTFVYVVNVTNTEAIIPESQAVSITSAGIDLLADG